LHIFQGTRSSKNIHIKYEVEVKEILTRAELVARGEEPTEGLQEEGLQELPEYPVYVR
jgi:hypothetical protein